MTCKNLKSVAKPMHTYGGETNDYNSNSYYWHEGSSRNWGEGGPQAQIGYKNGHWPIDKEVEN